MSEPGRTAGVIAPPPLLFAGALLAGVLADRAMGVRAFTPRVVGRPLGLAMAAAGLGLGIWAAVTMKRSGTAVVPHRPSTTVVRSGPFAWTRNPIYLGMTSAYIGLVLALGSLGGLLLTAPLLALVQRGVIEREEAYLQRLFGAAYRSYRNAVPRWL